MSDPNDPDLVKMVASSYARTIDPDLAAVDRRLALDEGGPAFPTPPVSVGEPREGWRLELRAASGMPLRDYFAGQALIGLLAWDGLTSTGTPEQVAHLAYELADAMITAKKNP
jgi:hypothetical protein